MVLENRLPKFKPPFRQTMEQLTVVGTFFEINSQEKLLPECPAKLGTDQIQVTDLLGRFLRLSAYLSRAK